MKSPLTITRRAPRRFVWTICWTHFHRQISPQAQRTLLAWEDKTGHFVRTGTPLPFRAGDQTDIDGHTDATGVFHMESFSPITT